MMAAQARESQLLGPHRDDFGNETFDIVDDERTGHAWSEDRRHEFTGGSVGDLEVGGRSWSIGLMAARRSFQPILKGATCPSPRQIKRIDVKVLVTGAAGFIGYHVARHLMKRGVHVVGLDVVNAYYDPALKEARLRDLVVTASASNLSFEFHREDLCNSQAVDAVFKTHRFDRVIHLAAQAGVRHSLEAPREYVESNVVGFLSILEACRAYCTPHLTYASTSSVYGANTAMPFSEHHGADHPLQLYAATKRANELMAHAYSHLFKLPTTSLRFFTVYGPWGRPDMALFLFAKAILAGEPIKVFNNGNHTRDFTYVDDIAEGVIRASDHIAQPNSNWSSDRPDPATSNAPFRILNIGNNAPVQLGEYIAALEQALGKTARRELLPLQQGDVADTFADVSELEQAVGYRPTTSVPEGVALFAEWYRNYYSV